MTQSSARAAAADAIRARFPETDADGQHIVRVIEVLPITERDIPRLADGLWDAIDATVPTDRGPAAIAVMARGRAGETQAIELTAYTIIRSRLEIELDDAGRGRGLAMLDEVEGALQSLPAGLPDLLCESAAIRLDPTVTDADPTVHIYATRCTWPSAFPDEQTDSVGSSTSAIRDHVAGVIGTALPAMHVRQRGRIEADRRAALIAGDVPRAWITLHTQRETIGGSPDFVERPSMEWQDSETPPRTWRAQSVTQTVVVHAHVAHRTEDLADEAILRIAGELTGGVVVWPGDFDARVLRGGVMVTERLSGGQYELGRLDLLMFDRAEWDAEAGLAEARLQFSVETVDPIEPATQAVQVTAGEKDAAYVRFQAFDAGMVRRTEAATLADGQWSVGHEPVMGGAAQELRLKVSPSRRVPMQTRWQDGTELVLGNPAAPSAVLEIMEARTWNGATGTGTADVILLAGTLPAVGAESALQVRDG